MSERVPLQLCDKLLELEALQRELHASYRLIRYNRLPKEMYSEVLLAIDRERDLRQSIRTWLEWQGRERRQPIAATGTEG